MLTPLMKQYMEIKDRHKDSILFFRLGDFYEMFNEDAKIASQILGITLTSRNKDKNIPMAGIPYHSAASYIAKLVAHGHKIAMCEQSNDISGKLVKREVVKVITPGTFSDPDFLDSKSNNYILSFCSGFNGSSLSYMDVTTGLFKTLESESKECLNILFKLMPKEIILGTVKNDAIKKEIETFAKNRNINLVSYQIEKKPEEFLKNFFNVNSLSVFGIENKKYSLVSSASLLKYVSEIQDCSSVKSLNYENSNSMVIDYSSQENLNLLSGSKSLLSVIDKTKNALGGRFLKQSLLSPLVNKEEIEARYDDIEYFINNTILRSEFSNSLKEILDFERSFNRILRKEANIRDMNVLRRSLRACKGMLILDDKFFSVELETLNEILEFLERSILESNAISIKEGNIINPSFNKELEELHRIGNEGKSYILELEAKERENTKIKGLKISYNRVFGYYIEVTKANASLVPESYIRKQTLTNAERYVTQELKEYEEKVLNAKEKICELEFQLFNEIADVIAKKREFFEALAKDVSYLDFILALSEVALDNNYSRAKLKESGEIILTNSRHPIIELLVDNFVDNDLILKDSEIIILTGPNMSGKSTFMRQVALISILAQMGSFVPASYAELPIVDKLFTRVGANDDLASGQSTFMVEMNEVANIINNATDKSLIILDEVGRGTSTFDGIAIATAVTEYLHDNIGAKTIFATHYHELNELETRLDNVSNYRIEVEELRDKVVFLKKIVPGNADKSYGVEVARLAGLPNSILDRSRSLLKQLSNKKEEEIFDESIETQAISLLKDIDLENTSPIDLYKKIDEILKLIS